MLYCYDKKLWNIIMYINIMDREIVQRFKCNLLALRWHRSVKKWIFNWKQTVFSFNVESRMNFISPLRHSVKALHKCNKRMQCLMIFGLPVVSHFHTCIVRSPDVCPTWSRSSSSFRHLATWLEIANQKRAVRRGHWLVGVKLKVAGINAMRQL